MSQKLNQVLEMVPEAVAGHTAAAVEGDGSVPEGEYQDVAIMSLGRFVLMWGEGCNAEAVHEASNASQSFVVNNGNDSPSHGSESDAEELSWDDNDCKPFPHLL